MLDVNDRLAGVVASHDRGSTAGALGNVGSVVLSDGSGLSRDHLSTADGDCLSSRAFVHSRSNNILLGDGTVESSDDVGVLGGKRANVDGLGNRDDGGDDSVVLASAERAVGDSRCAGRDGDDGGAVNSGSAERTANNAVGRHSSHGAGRADGQSRGLSDSASLDGRLAVADEDSRGLDLSSDDSDGLGSIRAGVNANAESRVEVSGDDGGSEGAVESASSIGVVEGGSSALIVGRAEVNAVAKAGREASGLTLAGLLDVHSSTDESMTALNGEGSTEGVGDDISVQLGADERLKASSSGACRRLGAGGRVGRNSAGRAGAVVGARLDSSEGNSRSILSGTSIDLAVESASVVVAVESGSLATLVGSAGNKAVVEVLTGSLGESEFDVEGDTIVGDVDLDLETNTAN